MTRGIVHRCMGWIVHFSGSMKRFFSPWGDINGVAGVPPKIGGGFDGK
jgi:hypothetical protein